MIRRTYYDLIRERIGRAAAEAALAANEPLYHGSLDGSEYRSLLAENGFQVVSRLNEDPTDGGHAVWLAQFA